MPRRLKRPEGDPLLLALIVVALLLVAYWRWANGPSPSPPTPPGEYLLCSWNAENLFDDEDDPNDRDEDEDWFGRNPQVVAQKMANLSKALVMQAGGQGPDILVLVEVENRRAAQLLQKALNERLPTELAYKYLIFRENRTGRRIAPAILSRVPGEIDESLSFPPTRRILPARLRAGSRPLLVLASHWTSRMTDKTGAKRDAYADDLYKAVEEIGTSADILLCGDFNDEPDDPSVREHLHATGDPAKVGDGSPYLLDLLAGKDPERYGTIRFNGRWRIFDQIAVSPGLLDPSGWLVLPDTVRVENDDALRIGRDGHPWRFGNERSRQPRGFSDHFAVSVRLKAG